MRIFRLAVSWVLLLGSMLLWLLFELRLIGAGEPPLTFRLSCLAIMVEGFNGVSINTND